MNEANTSYQNDSRLRNFLENLPTIDITDINPSDFKAQGKMRI